MQIAKNHNLNIICLLAVGAAFLLGMNSVAAAQDSEITDTGIRDAIENEYLFDTAAPSDRIDLDVTNGIVTLTGKVGSLRAKKRAARIAETVKGVRSVINRIEVKPKTRPDSAIRRDVVGALIVDPAADSYEVDVTVHAGEVTLTGTVESWQERMLAEKVASGVSGVTKVTNEIDVEYEEARTDDQIAADIRQVLRWDVMVDGALVDVNVNDGNVRLAGVVGSAAERRRARYDAWVAGVESVDDSGLKVERWARDEDLRKNKYAIRSADKIKQAVKDALLYDPRVLSFNVTPEVAGSTVTLRGVVDNLKAKRAAAQVARRTVGVTSVTNRLKVRPVEDVPDDELVRSVRDALRRNPYVEKYEITATAIDGTVYLSGRVDTYFEKSEADDAVSKVHGVVEVRNNLTVDTTRTPLVYDPYLYDPYPYDYDWYDYEPYYTYETDAEIKEDIESEMWWSPFVDSDQVNVAVNNGTATLTGTVDTWSELESATENAYEGGAVWVNNELAVE